MNRKAYRVERLEKRGERFTDPNLLSDDELIEIIFGHDTPELRAAQALQRAGDDAGFDRMLLAVIEREEATALKN